MAMRAQVTEVDKGTNVLHSTRADDSLLVSMAAVSHGVAREGVLKRVEPLRNVLSRG